MPTNDEDTTPERMPEIFNEAFRRTQSQRIRRGQSESAANGFFVSSKAPYGYRKTTVDYRGRQRATLELNPPASETVRKVFDQLLQGITEQNITAELNATGTPGPNGGVWTRAQINRIRTNEVYCGTNVWGRRDPGNTVRAPNAFPAIVSQDEFNQVQQ